MPLFPMQFCPKCQMATEHETEGFGAYVLCLRCNTQHYPE